MAKSTYISSNLTRKQIEFLQLLDEYEILYFSLKDIEDRLGLLPNKLNELVENLYQKRFLARIERGKYTRLQFQDPYVLGTFISRDGLVAYWSALHLHGLTERFPNKVFIKTTDRKRNTQLFGTTIHFVCVQQRKMIGMTHFGYNDQRYPLTNIEITLFDCFDQPRYAGDWPDLLKAFSRASLNAKKLIKYATMYNNKSVIKRMAFLIELLGKNELSPFLDFARKNIGKKYILFEPGGADVGTFNNRWKLRMNMDENAILNSIQNTY